MVKRKPLKPRTAGSLAKYGLTVEEWAAMLEAQGGVCFLCHKGGKLRHLSVDHDHQIEKRWGEMVPRALLCARCNSGFGRFEWSDEVLERLIEYAKRVLLDRSRYEVYIETSPDNIDTTGGTL